MIKHIIFDLDGVLVDTKIIHYKSLNLALEKENKKYVIEWDEHLKNYDGLSTIKKLEILNRKKKLPKKKFTKIIESKKKYTKKLLKKEIKFNKKIFELFSQLSKKYFISVASNAIEDTVVQCLNILKINKFVGFLISNEDVKYIKPNPQIFLKCMIYYGVSPGETLVLEDSENGRIAALNSGAKLFPVEKLSDVNKKNIYNKIKEINSMKNKKGLDIWVSDKLNVLIPMAGLGSRFKDAGYTFPKPLIEVEGKPMIQVVVENLGIEANFIFIVQKEHREKYNVDSMLKLISKNYQVVEVDGLTNGAACTTLLAKKFINNNNQLLIANSDQFVEWNPIKTMYYFTSSKIDGGILTFPATHPRWSFAKTNNKNEVLEVAEKNPISNNATVGIYFWNKGSEYVKYCEKMIEKKITTNNEYYVCPVYNEAIKDGKKIKIYKVDKMWGLGTPEDLNIFLNRKKY